MAELKTISELDDADPLCTVCDGEGWVCEGHPDKSWGDPKNDGYCDCGAGMPCVCNPLYSAGHTKH